MGTRERALRTYVVVVDLFETERVHIDTMAKSIPKPNPLVDGVLMLIFVIELGIIGTTLFENDREMLAYLLGLIVVVAIAVAVTKYVFATAGGWFSRTFLQHLGDPLKKTVTMKKWCDQSWQLVIHASMTIFELVVLADETWWQDTTTCAFCFLRGGGVLCC